MLILPSRSHTERNMAALNKWDMDTNAHDLDYEPNFSHSRALTVNDVDLAEALAAKLLCHCASSRAIAVQQDDLGALLYLFEGSHLKAESMQEKSLSRY